MRQPRSSAMPSSGSRLARKRRSNSNLVYLPACSLIVLMLRQRTFGLRLFRAPAGDVADADNPDRPVVLNDGNVTEAVLEHDLRRVLRCRVGCQRDRVGTNPPANARHARMHAA